MHIEEAHEVVRQAHGVAVSEWRIPIERSEACLEVTIRIAEPGTVGGLVGKPSVLPTRSELHTFRCSLSSSLSR